jgi:molecular chaperone GrpE
MSSTPTSPSVETATESENADATEAPPQRTEEPDPRLLRALADLDNLRKRYEARLAQAAEEERRRVTALWFPVIDDLERALHHVVDDSMVEGLRAVYQKALAVLASIGFEPFHDVEVPFDPTRHEAIGTVDSEREPGTVVAVIRPGWTHHGVVVRPAHVFVARPPTG